MILATPSRSLIGAAAAALVLVNCSAASPDEAASRSEAKGSDSRPAKPRASQVAESSDLLEFSYAYPREAAAIPKLAEWLVSDRAAKRDALTQAAQRDREAAARGEFPYRPHSHLQRWDRVTDTPRFLSLSAEIATYSGGAHGMTYFDTLLWDRNRQKLRKPLDLFTTSEAFDAAIRDRFCEAIKRAKAAKGIVAEESPDSPFGQCPPASSQTVWLGSSDGRYLDRLTIGIGPYEIGPYAEGSYKVNVSVTRALVDAVKPDYARDFLPIN